MTPRGRGRGALVIALLVSGHAAGSPAAPASSDAPPASLLSGQALHGAAIDAVFADLELATLGKLSCKFVEEKHVALLARPLRSTGTIYFARDRGIARTTLAPRPEQVVLTQRSLRIRKGARIEEVPLDKTKELRAFAMIFPTLLRGDRGELERAFEIGVHRGDHDWWALAFTPKSDALRKLVRRVVVFGRKAEIVSLQVIEASGDTTDTQLTEIHKNGSVPDAEIATAFGAS